MNSSTPPLNKGVESLFSLGSRVVALGLCGIRKGEIVDLKWKDAR